MTVQNHNVMGVFHDAHSKGQSLMLASETLRRNFPGLLKTPTKANNHVQTCWGDGYYGDNMTQRVEPNKCSSFLDWIWS